MADNREVTFRRIRGRIVPIKRKGSSKGKSKKFDPTIRTKTQQKKDRVAGAGFLAGGILGAGITGYFSGKLFKKGVNIGREIETFTKGAAAVRGMKGVDPKLQKAVSQHMLGSAGRKLPKFGRTMATSRTGLALAGSSLLFGGMAAEGVTKIVQSARSKEITSSEAIASATTGIVVGKAVETGFKSGAGRSLIRKLITKGRF